MSKKRIAVIVAGVAMFATLAVGSTMAWFTDTEEATNKFTMGFVDVVLNDNSKDAKLTDNDEGIALQFADVMPGDELDKAVSFKLADNSADAYIRAKVDFDYADGLAVSEDPALTLGEDANAITYSNWTYDDGYYYYTGEGTIPIALTADDGAVNFFDTVNIPEGWDNAMTNQDFTLTITVDAIQAENFDLDNDSWDIDDYEE